MARSSIQEEMLLPGWDVPAGVALALPVIVCPFSRFGDEVAGYTPSEIALNLAAATKISLRFRRKPLRPCPDLKAAFWAYKSDLSAEAGQAIKWTMNVYEQFANRQKTLF